MIFSCHCLDEGFLLHTCYFDFGGHVSALQLSSLRRLHEAWPSLCLPCVSQLSFKLVVHLKQIQEIRVDKTLASCRSVLQEKCADIWKGQYPKHLSIVYMAVAFPQPLAIHSLFLGSDVDPNGATWAPHFLYAPGIWT